MQNKKPTKQEMEQYWDNLDTALLKKFILLKKAFKNSKNPNLN